MQTEKISLRENIGISNCCFVAIYADLYNRAAESPTDSKIFDSGSK